VSNVNAGTAYYSSVGPCVDLPGYLAHGTKSELKIVGKNTKTKNDEQMKSAIE